MKTKNDTKLHKLSLSVMLGLGLIASPNLFAQETDDLLEESEEEVTEVVERVTVTGSRIKRAEFSQASPIQVIDGEISRELGLFDAAELLQTTSQVSGLQIDNTFGGFVLDNGPGAATVGFRGLGPDRTLVLVNGRRLAPAGVGGAPSAPDLNLIPAVMIERIENLFDGASTVYGSDAIAGVSNAILRTDVDGFEFQGSYSDPDNDGAEETVLSLIYGTNGDNYNFTVAGEFFEARGQSYAENSFVSNCDEIIQEGLDGNIYSEYRGIGPNVNPAGNCDIFPLSNRVFFDSFFGSVYYTPGFTNTGIPNFSDSTTGIGNLPFINGLSPADSNGDGVDDVAIYDGDGDGLRDFDFQDPFYALGNTDYVNSADWRSPLRRTSVFLNGDYLFNDDNDTRFFYEGLYSRRESDVFSPGGQFFPTVSADNPFNPCGTDPINGNSCYSLGSGLDAFFGDQRFLAQPIISVRGDRDTNVVDVYQYRVVGGLDGNIGALADFGEGNWSYEVSANYSYSKGVNTIEGISEERLDFSLENSVRLADGTISCGPDCVPINMFAPYLYQEGGGEMTPEERAYLFTERRIETEVKQTVFSGFVTGDLYSLPWNNEIVPLVVGVEWRKDEIITNANDVAAQGLLWGYFSDQGADGDRTIKEFFFETEFPLLKGEPFAEELTVTAAGRWTNESFYDPETVWSLKGVYRPTEYLTIRGTRGTSYRAPNLRERFLNGTSGFNTVSDPCVVPNVARDSSLEDPTAPEIYVEDQDPREQRVLTSCIANGVDPTTLGLRANGNAGRQPAGSTEITTGGTEALNPETSVSTTYGFIFEQPFTDAFDLTFSMTRYNIEITNSVAEPSAGFIVSQCYNNPEVTDGTSGFCPSVVRGADGFIEGINASFINIGFEGAEGTDYNLFYNQGFLIGDQELDVTWDVLATKVRSQRFDILGTADENLGEPTTPEWRGSSRISFSYDDFRFNWLTRYIGAGEADDLGDFLDDNIACDGLEVQCRPISYTGSYLLHSASINYQWDNMSATFGIQNIFDEEPQKVGTRGNVFNTRNIPLGVGYDTAGRTLYVSFGASF